MLMRLGYAHANTSIPGFEFRVVHCVGLTAAVLRRPSANSSAPSRVTYCRLKETLPP